MGRPCFLGSSKVGKKGGKRERGKIGKQKKSSTLGTHSIQGRKEKGGLLILRVRGAKKKNLLVWFESAVIMASFDTITRFIQIAGLI